jgi:hypothetical protein
VRGRRAGEERQSGSDTSGRDGTGGTRNSSKPRGSRELPVGWDPNRSPARPVPSRLAVFLPPWGSRPARRPPGIPSRTSFTCSLLPYGRLLALLALASATCPNCVSAVSQSLEAVPAVQKWPEIAPSFYCPRLLILTTPN